MLYIERYQPDSALILEENLATAQKNILNFVGNNQDKRKIKSFINREMDFAFDDIPDEVVKDIENITGTTWNSMGSIMAQGFVTDTLANSFKDFKDISKSTHKKLINKNNLIQGHTLDEHFKHLNSTTTRKLQGLIVDGFDKGKGIDEINRNVRNAIGGVNRNQSKTLIRTSLLEATEKAKNEALESFEDEILEWKFSASLDSRTSKYCFLHNGYTTKDKSKAKYRPKTHYNCRSMWLPVTEFSKALEDDTQNLVQWNGKKVNHRDGTKSTKFKVGEVKKIPKNATPEQVFNAFDKDYQIQFMGKKRYSLYTSGKMKFDEAFNMSRGKLLHLDKIEKRIASIVKSKNVKHIVNKQKLPTPSIALDVDKKLSKKQLESITKMDDLEAITQFNKTEHAGLFKADGTKIFAKKGGKNSVNFNRNEVSLMNDNILTHNHPNGFGFSAEDLYTAIATNLREIRAVGSEHIYRFVRPDKGWNDKVSVPTSFLKFAREKMRYIKKTETEINKALEEIAEAYNLTYIREKI